MKITDIRTKQYAAWRNLSLQLQNSSVNLLYGPNEAGKTTLMRMIRGVLYGFKNYGEPSSSHVGNTKAWDGTLRIRHHDKRYKIRRRWQSGGRGKVTIKSINDQNQQQPELNDLLSGMSEPLFESVYALGLYELQELATLHADDVAEQIYGLSLGPEGEQLRDVAEQINQHKRRLLSTNCRQGEIASLLDEEEKINNEIALLTLPLEKHRDFSSQQLEINEEISQLKQQQQGIESELRGAQFLAKVWNPWKQAQLYAEEMSQIPSTESFSEKNRNRLVHLEELLKSYQQERVQLQTEYDAIIKHNRINEINDSLLEYESDISSLIDLQDWFEKIHKDYQSAKQQENTERLRMSEELNSRTADWTTDRLKEINISPDDHFRFLTAAKNYQSALNRWGRLRNRYQCRVKANKQRVATFEDQIKLLGGLSIEDSLSQTRDYLRELDELSSLRLLEQELSLEQRHLNNQISLLENHEDIPDWVQMALWVFAILGVGFCVWGILEWNYKAIAGAVYVMIGLMSGGVAWGMREHYLGGEGIEDLEFLRSRHADIEHSLRECREEIEYLTSGNHPCLKQPLFSQQLSQSEGMTDIERIQLTNRNLLLIEKLKQEQSEIAKTRQNLSTMRTRFKSVQQSVGDARQKWCDLLRSVGLPESLKLKESFSEWQDYLRGETLYRNWTISNHNFQQAQTHWNEVSQRIQLLINKTGTNWNKNQPMLSVLEDWKNQLKNFRQLQNQQQQVQAELDKLTLQIEENRSEIKSIEEQISLFLTEAGVDSVDEFNLNLQKAGRYTELLELKQLADLEVQEIAATEPEIAIVEDDLLEFDDETNRRYIARLTREQAEIDQTLQGHFENLGRLKQKLAALEEDRRWSRLRLKRAQIQEQLRTLLEEWLGVQLAERAMHEARAGFEKNFQPATLVSASDYLSQLTEGKYQKVWTPLDKRYLCIDDQDEQTFMVNELSGGTREQLFLAIRLAVVDRFREQGIELPMILDDIFVNFDQQRTEAAVRTLYRFSEQGQQIVFFTCHQHLVDLFQKQGIKPISLPDHRQARVHPSSSKSSILTSKQRGSIVRVDHEHNNSLSLQQTKKNNPADSDRSHAVVVSRSQNSVVSPETERDRHRLDQTTSQLNISFNQQSESARAAAAETSQQPFKSPAIEFRLDKSMPVVDAPSIGPKTARKLRKINVRTVNDLLQLSPGESAKKLKQKRITADVLATWQKQAELVCRIPHLRGHDAQILVAINQHDPVQLASMKPQELFSQVEPFVKTSKGKRILRSGKEPDLQEITNWIEWAKQSRPLKAA